MKHMTEEELIAYREGIVEQRAIISEHLAACEECRSELERIEAVLAALDTLPVPDPGTDYGRRVWQEIAPRLAEKPGRWWQVWFEPRRLSAAGAVVALIVAAFVAGRITKRGNTGDDIANKEQVRERILVVAVGEHLGHSERMLVELSNAAPNNPAQKEVNISAEQRRAEDLLQENRLYRQTALQEGDAGLASVLDELERVLLDVAHSPDEVTPAQLEAIQKKIEARGILFKVRVVNKELQQRQEAREPAPAQNESTKRERNKV
jgi:anti-sigma factor RsiW